MTNKEGIMNANMSQEMRIIYCKKPDYTKSEKISGILKYAKQYFCFHEWKLVGVITMPHEYSVTAHWCKKCGRYKKHYKWEE